MTRRDLSTDAPIGVFALPETHATTEVHLFFFSKVPHSRQVYTIPLTTTDSGEI